MSEPFQVITTKQLMDQNSVVKLDIKVIQIQYPDYLKKELSGMDYKAEIDYLVTNETRNKLIAGLANNCKGTTLVLFTFIHKHGALLDSLIRSIVHDKRVVKFIHGGVDVEDREEVRKIAETEPDAIIIASSSIFSTGTNIP